MSHQKFELILNSREQITPRVLKLGFRREDDRPLEFVPGQFVTLHLPWQDVILRRSYSIASIPGGAAGPEVEIAVTCVEGGRATVNLQRLRPGERVEATGPFGRFVLRDDSAQRCVLVATGTGVSPYRSMLPELRRRLGAPDFEAILLLGVRGPAELLFGGEFRVFARENPRFSFRPVFSRHRPAARDKAAYGYVQHRLADLNLARDRDIVYLCGNPDMIDEAVAHLKGKGFANPQIRREKYVSSN